MAKYENHDRPFFNVNQPNFSIEKPKMQSVFHFRKHNRDKINQSTIQTELDGELTVIESDAPEETSAEVLNLEIIEPVTNQPTSFSLFDLSIDPESLVANLKEAMAGHSPNHFDDTAGQDESVDETVDETVDESVDEQEDSLQNEYLDSLSIINMANGLLQDILKSHQREPVELTDEFEEE